MCLFFEKSRFEVFTFRPLAIDEKERIENDENSFEEYLLSLKIRDPVGI